MKQIRKENTTENINYLEDINSRISQEFWKNDKSHISSKYGKIEYSGDGGYIRLKINEDDTRIPEDFFNDELEDLTEENWNNKNLE